MQAVRGNVSMGVFVVIVAGVDVGGEGDGRVFVHVSALYFVRMTGPVDSLTKGE